VLRAALAPDGRRVASAGNDGKGRLWDVATGAQLAELLGHTAAVRGFVFSPDGQLLASGSIDSTVRLWDAASGQMLKVLSGHGSIIQDLVISSDGLTLASSSLDGTIRLWHLPDGTPGFVLHTPAQGIAFSPDGRRLASAGTDRLVHLWDVKRGVSVAEGLIPEEPRGVGFLADGRSVVVGLIGGVYLWDTVSRKGSMAVPQPGATLFIAAHPDGRRIGIPGWRGAARIWDLRAGKGVTLPGHGLWDVNSIRFDASGKLAVTASDDGAVRIFDAGDGRPIWRARQVPIAWEGARVVRHAPPSDHRCKPR
jgi:WD40 repeat protein